MKCEHCFYWESLNQRDDLSFDEIVSLSRELGPIENLNLSGGEPFLRKEFGAICRQFIRQNGVKEIYVPSNGWYTDKTIAQIRETLREPDLRLFAVELSLDGMPECHDRFRGAPGAVGAGHEDLGRPGRVAARRLAAANPFYLDRDRRKHGRDTAVDDFPLRPLPANVASQSGADSRRSQKPVAPRSEAGGIRVALRLRATLVGAARAKPLWQHRRADAAMGQGQDRYGATTGGAVPRRRAQRRDLRQW